MPTYRQVLPLFRAAIRGALIGAATVCVALAAAIAPAARAAATDPKPLATVSPGYPAALAGSAQSGTATVDILVRADGSVADAKLRSADHPAFGEAALAAVTQWRFEPSTRDGVAVERQVVVPFQFAAPFADVVNARLKRKVFQKVAEPVLTQKEYGKRLKAKKPPQPGYPAAAKGARQEVEVRFVVAPDGTTLNPELIGEPRREFVAPAIIAIAAATYEPPVKDGKGVYVSTTTKLNFAPPQPARGKRGGGGFGGDPGGGFGGGGTPDP